MPAVLGALTGAIVSFIPLYFIQNRAFKKDEKIRASEYKRSQQALGRSLVLKLSRIYSDIYIIHKNIEISFQRLNKIQSDFEPWGILKPFAVIPDKITISFDELGMLLSLGDNNLLTKVQDMIADHEMVLSEAILYGKLRKELLKKLPVSHNEGTIASSNQDFELSPDLKVQMETINEFISKFRYHSSRGASDSKVTLNELNEFFRDKLEIS